MVDLVRPDSWKNADAARTARRWHPMPVLAMTLVMAAVVAGPEVKAQFAGSVTREAGETYVKLVDALVDQGIVYSPAVDGAAAQRRVRIDSARNNEIEGKEDWRPSCRADSFLAMPRAVATWLVGIETGDAADCKEMIDAFSTVSFLGPDSDANCDGRIWICDGARVTLVPDTRRIRTAIADRRVRPVIFANASGFKLQVTAAGVEHDLMFDRAASAGSYLKVIGPASWTSERTDAAGAWCFGAADADDSCNDGIGFWPVGDQMLLTSEGGAPPQITIDGVPLVNENNRGDTASLAWRFLPSDQPVTIRDGNRSVTVRLVAESATIGQTAGLSSLEQAVAAADPQGNGPIRTSLDQNLHASVQRLFDAFLEGKLGNRTSVGDTSFRASVTMMDAVTGEIAALPTFPHNQQQLHSTERTSGRRASWLSANVNFVRMPVGSTAKVPLAAAAVAANPDLGKPRCIGTWAGQLLGDNPSMSGKQVRSKRSRNDLACDQDMELSAFVTRSNNDYALDLMYRMLPRTGDFEWNPRSTGEQQDFMRYLWALDCIVPLARSNGGAVTEGWQGTEGCPETLWPDMVFGNEVAAAYINPDPVFLGFDDLNENSLIGDYFMSIIGGSRSTWSTITLAQAYSRIVTGTPVQARLLAGGAPSQDSAAWQPDTEGWLPARQNLLAGMQGVVVAGGTAAALRKPQIAGFNLKYFAKTGTSDVDVVAFSVDADQIQSPLYRAINSALAPSSRCSVYIRGDQSNPQIQVEGGVQCSGHRTAVVAAQAVGSSAVLRQRRALFEERDPVTGRLWELPETRTMENGQGHAFVFVVEARRGADDTGPPCATSTIAINIQHRIKGSDPRPSVEFASRMLADPVVQRWLTARCTQ